MTLQQVLAIYESTDTEVITSMEEKLKDSISQVKLSKIVDISYRSNIQLDIVFSENKEKSLTEFLYRCYEVLEYEFAEEMIGVKVDSITFSSMENECMLQETLAILKSNHVTADNCLSILKLKEKDELTILVEMPTHYIFISEYNWKS